MKKYILVSLILPCVLLSTLEGMQKPKTLDKQLFDATMQRDQPEAVARLLKAGANIEARDDALGRTPLMSAAYGGYLGAMKVLLDAGANVNAISKSLDTPLHQAVKGGKAKAVKIILDARPRDIDAVNKFDETPLLIAVGNPRDDITILDMLMKFQVNLLLTDKNGNTALHYAASKALPKTIKVLLSKGLAINAKNNKGETPLHKAAQSELVSEPEIAATKILIESGADRNAVNSAGTTPLMAAAREVEKSRNLGLGVNRGIVRALITTVSPQEVQHIIPTFIGAKRSGSEFVPRDVRLLIAKELIPAIVRERLARAKAYLPGASPQELEQEIRQSINRVIKKLSHTGELDKKAKEQIVQVIDEEDLDG